MYALAVQNIPDGKEWLYEVKFDGYREEYWLPTGEKKMTGPSWAAQSAYDTLGDCKREIDGLTTKSEFQSFAVFETPLGRLGVHFHCSPSDFDPRGPR